MTATPEPAAAAAAPDTDGPTAAAGGMGGQVDVRSLVAQRPGEAMWLLVTEVDGPAGAVFAASIIPGPQPRAFGGDVLLHLAPATSPKAPGAISVAAWTVAFAMSTMTELGEHLSLGENDPVDLDAATALAVPGLPWPLPASSQAAATG